MKRLKSIALMVGIFLVFDAGAAWYCRSNCAFWQNAYPPTDHRVRSDAYHHGLAPNRQITEAWGNARYRYATNSLGFKDLGPRDVELKGKNPRVLFLGDSFTEGKGFPYPETFVGLVAEKLASSGVEVLNGGVDSYAPVIYRLKTKHLLETVGLRIDSVVVFLDVSDIYDQARRYQKDAAGKLVVPPKPEDPASVRVRNFLREYSVIARFGFVGWDVAHFAYRYLRRRLEIFQTGKKPFWDVDAVDIWSHSVTRLINAAWTYNDDHWREFGKAGRKSARQDMDGLLALLRERGIALTLAVYPWPDQLYHDPKAPRYQGFWRDWAEANGVPFISLFPAFTDANPRDVLERLFIPYDFHWNADGHKLVAKTFLEKFTPPRR
jgi:lysophospholipase L1-like esterase